MQEGERHRLGHPAGRQGAPRLGPAFLRQIHRARRHGAFQAHGHGGDFVEAEDTEHFFDQIGLADNVVAPSGHGAVPAAVFFGQLKTEDGQDAFDLFIRHVDAAQGLHPAFPQEIAAGDIGLFADNDQLRRLAAAQLQDELAGEFRTGPGEGRVNTPFKPEAGIRL